MTDNVKQLAPQIWTQIKKSQNILLHCHPSPDADSICSALSLMHLLTDLNKKSTVIIGDSDPPLSLKHLPGFDKIQNKNFLEINLNQFDLFIIVDCSSLNQITKLGPVIFPTNLTTVVIDHHSNNKDIANINLVDVTYPATGQILYELFKIWGVNISSDIAACLYMSIYTDSGGFKYYPTGKDTLLAAADLAEIYPDFFRDIFTYENSLEPEQIAYLALAFNSIEHFFSERVAISLIPYNELSRRGIRKKHTEKMEVSNFLKAVIGWEVGITMNEVAPDEINLSFRTRDETRFDVSKIAQATGFGGGHPAAAGATLKMPIDQAKQLVLASISKVYPDLGSP